MNDTAMTDTSIDGATVAAKIVSMFDYPLTDVGPDIVSQHIKDVLGFPDDHVDAWRWYQVEGLGFDILLCAEMPNVPTFETISFYSGFVDSSGFGGACVSAGGGDFHGETGYISWDDTLRIRASNV